MTTRTVTIRRAAYHDLPQVLELYAHLHDEPPGSEDDVASAWRSLLEGPNLQCFVAEIEGHLVSTCTLVIVPNLTRRARPYGLIENVVTHADHRRRGTGTALLKHTLGVAWERQCYKVMLLTGRTDEAVLRFYERVGFVRGLKTGFVATPDGV